MSWGSHVEIPSVSHCKEYYRLLLGTLDKTTFQPVRLHFLTEASTNMAAVFWVVAPFSLVEVCLLSRKLEVKIYKTIILPVVMYGCETWSLTLREEHRLRVFENRVLRRFFGPKRDEVTGEWRKLHNRELHNLYSSPDIIRQIKSRRMRWAGHVARMGEG
jgi:hypothetical protein